MVNLVFHASAIVYIKGVSEQSELTPCNYLCTNVSNCMVAYFLRITIYCIMEVDLHV